MQPTSGLNYKGSSPVMETVGAEKIFKLSVTKYNLCNNSFCGVDDSN